MNKRKVLSILLLALITVTLAVSCSGSIDAPAQDAEELAYVTFGNGHSRGLSTSYETEAYGNLFWFYTAQKTDSYGTTGQVGLNTDNLPTAAVSKGDNNAPKKGLSGQVGPFSQGAWDFTLYAYKEADRTTLVYKSKAVHVILKGNEVKNVPVSVSTQGSNGYVKFKNAFFKWDGNSGDSTPTMEIKLTPATGSAITNTITLNNKGTDGKLTITDDTKVVSSESVDTIPADFYTANVIVYLKDDDLGIDNKGTPVFSQTFGLRVYGNATTYISGDMVEGVTSEVTFDVADKKMVVFSPTDGGAASFNVAVSPKGATTGSGTDTNTTKVEFPAGALAGAEHQLDVAVTPIASAEQNFQISGENNNETAVAGIDFRMVKVEEQSGSLKQTPVTSFGKDDSGSDRKVKITTYIATGLSNVQVKYLDPNNGPVDITKVIENTVTESTAPYYNPATGMLIFETSHFSQYVVVASVEALNVSTGVPYATLASAIEGAGDGQEIQLMKNVKIDRLVIKNKAVALDLAGYSIEESDTVYLKSGLILVDNNGSLTINDSSPNATGKIDVTTDRTITDTEMPAVFACIAIWPDKGYKASLTINGGKLKAPYYAIVGNGTTTHADCTKITINGGSIEATSGLAIYHPQNGNVIINGGSLTGTQSAIEVRAGNLVINNGELTATSTEFECEPNGSGTTTIGAAIAIAQHTTKKDISVEINGGTFNGVKALNESNPQTNDPRPQVAMSVSGGTFNGEVSVTDTSAFISGGTFSSDPSTYIADGCTVALNGNSKYVVTEQKLWIDYADTNIPTDTDGKYLISTPAQLACLAKLVNSGEKTFSGETVRITDDIDLAGKIWTPIGPNADSGNKFQGILDGSYTDENGNEKSHVISNMTVSQGASYRAAGFFGALNGTAQNLEFDSATVTSLSGPNSGGSTDNGNAVVAGSIYTSGTIENVTVKSSSVSANRYVGGIAGYVYGRVENCIVENTVLTATPDNLTGAYDNGDKIGGVVGYLAEGNNNIVNNCNVSGSNTIITGYRDIGGVVGYANGQTTVSGNTISGGKITVDNTHNYKGYATGAAHDANPIVGEASGNASVTDNNGDSSVTITRPSYTN